MTTKRYNSLKWREDEADSVVKLGIIYRKNISIVPLLSPYCLFIAS